PVVRAGPSISGSGADELRLADDPQPVRTDGGVAALAVTGKRGAGGHGLRLEATGGVARVLADLRTAAADGQGAGRAGGAVVDHGALVGPALVERHDLDGGLELDLAAVVAGGGLVGDADVAEAGGGGRW